MIATICKQLTLEDFAMSGSSNQELKILIVDDDAVDRMALRRTLQGTAFLTSTSEAVDAESASTLLAKGMHDCIFLDYDLPGKNGLQLIREIRRRGIRVPIIVLTGHGNEQTAVELMKAGASDYLVKSRLSPETISRSMRGALKVFKAEMIAEKANFALREKNELLEKSNQELARQRRYIHQQNLRLQEVSRLKSEFLATMSHELRTPLNAIIGFSQILMNGSKGPLNDSQSSMVNRVLVNGRNLLELINDILTFSKAEAGRTGLELSQLDLAHLVQAAVDEIRSAAAQKGLEIDVDIDLSNSTVVNDPVRLQQILMNLLSNAVKFTAEGSIKVQVGDRPSPANEQTSKSTDIITLSVTDTGCGIPVEEQLYIFDPFHQADQKVTRRHSGTGLGLAIIHSFVKMMEGEVSLVSQVNEGTTFTIEVPREIVLTKEMSSPNDTV